LEVIKKEPTVDVFVVYSPKLAFRKRQEGG